MNPPASCVNCRSTLSEGQKFCAQCGQHAAVKRITFKEGWHDFLARIYGFDGMFPRTLRDLTLRPGVATRRFIEGNRVSYYGPVGYFFLMVTLVLLLVSILSIDLVPYLKEGNFLSPLQPKVRSTHDAFVSSVMGMVTEYYRLFSFLVIPIQAWYARHMFFRKSGLNFTENMVHVLFVVGHLYWITMINLVVYAIAGVGIPNPVVVVIALSYFAYSYYSLFPQQGIKAFFKGLGVLAFAQVTFIFVAAIIIGLVILNNDELLRQLKSR